jgi:hypothetical protein
MLIRILNDDKMSAQLHPLCRTKRNNEFPEYDRISAKTQSDYIIKNISYEQNALLKR